MAVLQFNQRVIEASTILKPFAIRLTRDSEDAHDLIQETMFRAISNADKFEEGTNLKAWLFTIMKNIFINDYRKKIKRNTVIDSTDNLFYINSSKSITNNGERSFIMQDIRAALMRISSELRVPFMMHYKGFKYHEIAQKLNLPLGTVKSRIFFARKELKDQLRVEYGR
jgi:RNA polymerase sigma-70 factor (ECF subfamily)